MYGMYVCMYLLYLWSGLNFLCNVLTYFTNYDKIHDTLTNSTYGGWYSMITAHSRQIVMDVPTDVQ